MAGEAKKIDVIYVDTMETHGLVVTLGDSIRGQDWARKEYADDAGLQEERGGMYAIYLAAKRAGAPHTGGTWLDWLDFVTVPDAEEDKPEAPAEGESDGPPSGV